MHYVCYLLNHISCDSLKDLIPLTNFYCVTPDISIIMMQTFYQSVYYASHNQSFPSTSEEKHAYWVGFSEHVSDAITHKLQDSSSQKVINLFVQQMIFIPTSIYFTDLEEPVQSNKTKHITFVKSHQALDISVSKHMAEYSPDDLIG